MSDENVHIQPAIPSRAAQAPASPFQQPAFLDQPSPGTEAPKKKKRKTKRMARLGHEPALSAAEIRKINVKRAAALRAAKKNVKKRIIAAPVPKKRNVAVGPKKSRGPVVAKNPNRPLEMKNQLSAVLSMVGTLQKQELVFFSQAVPAMQALSRSGRRRVISALQQVYG